MYLHKFNMHFEFVFPDETILLHIELENNPGTLAWATHFDGYQTQAFIHDHLYVPEINISNEHVYDLPRQQCLTTLSSLSKLGYIYSGPIPTSPDKVNAACLNQLHRYFTHNQKELNLSISKLRQKNQDPDQLVSLLQQVEVLLQDLNSCVHNMETYCQRAPTGIVVDTLEEIKLYHPTDHGTSLWFDLEPYKQYHTQEYCDVILSSEILGKTVLQSYIDQDDPMDWDTSGHYTSAGGVQIVLDDSRQKIYQSADFKQWLSKHNATNLYYDFPIGRVLDRSKLERIRQKLDQTRDRTYTVTYHQ
jgi:hypothetical protein